MTNSPDLDQLAERRGGRYAALGGEPMTCKSCGNPHIAIGHGDGDLLCDGCDRMRQAAVDTELARLAAFWTPACLQALSLAQGGYGKAPTPPRRVFRNASPWPWGICTYGR